MMIHTISSGEGEILINSHYIVRAERWTRTYGPNWYVHMSDGTEHVISCSDMEKLTGEVK